MNYEILFKVYEAMYPFITITTNKTAPVNEYNAWADWIDYVLMTRWSKSRSECIIPQSTPV